MFFCKLMAHWFLLANKYSLHWSWVNVLGSFILIRLWVQENIIKNSCSYTTVLIYQGNCASNGNILSKARTNILKQNTAFLLRGHSCTHTPASFHHSLALNWPISFSNLIAKAMSPLIVSFPDMKAMVGFSLPKRRKRLEWRHWKDLQKTK